MMTTVEVAQAFSKTPGGRFARLGPYSGEQFRMELEEILLRTRPDIVSVVLDGTEGYGSSFLEEAFGGLVRSGVIPSDELKRRVKIVARTSLFQPYADEAKNYFDDALRVLDN